MKKLLNIFFVSLFFFNSAQPAKANPLNELQAHLIVGEKIKKNALIVEKFRGISLIGIDPSENNAFDVPIVSSKKAMKVIKQALTLIELNSPFSKSQIEVLKKNGTVIIVYDPRYPKQKPTLNSVKIALFAPNYYNYKNIDSNQKTFLVIVSRHGVKWPIKELAAVLVHELVGHGVQHLNDNWNKMRLVDLECEAWLYEEMAYQDLQLDKFSREMIDFKKQLVEQCDSFLRYLRDSDPIGKTLWDNLNPDVPKLLKHFAVYQKQLKRNKF